MPTLMMIRASAAVYRSWDSFVSSHLRRKVFVRAKGLAQAVIRPGKEAGQPAVRGDGRTSPRGVTPPNLASSRNPSATGLSLPASNLKATRSEGSRQHLSIPAYPPPEPPLPEDNTGAQDAAFLAEKLLQRLSSLEETISKVVADTIQEEMRAKRRSENSSQL